MIELKVDLLNIAKVMTKMRGAEKNVIGAFHGAMYLLGCDIASRAMRMCPVDTGYLRQSRYVTKPDGGGSYVEVEVGFSAPYAIYVHEVPAYHANGRAKFLTAAIAEVSPLAAAFVSRKTLSLLKEGKTIADISPLQPTGPMLGQPLNAIGRRRATSLSARRSHGARVRGRVRLRRSLQAGNHG